MSKVLQQLKQNIGIQIPKSGISALRNYFFTKRKCTKRVEMLGESKTLQNATTLQNLAAAAKMPLGHLGAVLARNRLSQMSDNHIGLSNSLLATLICFAAQHESWHNAIMPSFGHRIDGFAEDTAQRLMVSLCKPSACYLTGLLALISMKESSSLRLASFPRLCEHLLSI